MTQHLLSDSNQNPMIADSVSRGLSTEQDSARAIKEVEVQMVLAKKFPRNEDGALNQLLNSCRRVKFAEVATYSYPKGGSKVEGPSIRMAEAAARAYGNLQYGFRELQRIGNSSVVQSYCWDLENNIRTVIEFNVDHVIDTKKGVKHLTTERDIYEKIANSAARRKRKCILEVIPEHFIEESLLMCTNTLTKDYGEQDIATVIQKLIGAFTELNMGIVPEHLEKRLGNKMLACSPAQVVSLRKIFASLRDGMSKASDWFDIEDKVKVEPEKKNELEDQQALIDAKTKLDQLLIKYGKKTDLQTFETVTANFDLNSLKGMRRAIDVIGSRLADATLPPSKVKK